MALIFAAITPHPPLLIPEIGREHCDKIKKTIDGMKTMEEKLYAAKPDIIIVVSPHGPVLADSFLFNLADEYMVNFKEFGDFSIEMKFEGDVHFINQIKGDIYDKTPVIISSEINLDHGAGVPLYYLTKHLKNFKIIPVSYSLLDYTAHVNFGNALKDDIFNSNKRIAVIASGDLSHRLTKDSPGGYSPRGQEFDEKLIRLLQEKKTNDIVNLDPKLIEEAHECGLRSILILLGLLERFNYEFELLSYEWPLGVGYLVGNYKLNF